METFLMWWFLAAFLLLMVLATRVMHQRDEARALAFARELKIADFGAQVLEFTKNETRLLQMVLYATRPDDEGLARIWGGMSVEAAAEKLFHELKVVIEERPTHAEFQQAVPGSLEGEVVVETTPKAVILREPIEKASGPLPRLAVRPPGVPIMRRHEWPGVGDLEFDPRDGSVRLLGPDEFHLSRMKPFREPEVRPSED